MHKLSHEYNLSDFPPVPYLLAVSIWFSPRVFITPLSCRIVTHLPGYINRCVCGYLVTPWVYHSLACRPLLAHLPVPPATLLLVLDGVLGLHNHSAVLGIGPTHCVHHRAGQGGEEGGGAGQGGAGQGGDEGGRVGGLAGDGVEEKHKQRTQQVL